MRSNPGIALTSTVLVALLACFAATSAVAGQFYFGGHGGLAFYSLKDLNDELDLINQEVGSNIMDDIKSGMDYGGQIGFEVSPAASLGLGYSRLNGNSEYSNPGGFIKYDFPVNAYEIHFTFLPPNEKTVRFGLGANLGMISSAGSVEFSETGGEYEKGDVEGNGLLFGGFGVVDFGVSSVVSIFGNVGYRYATISEIKVRNQVVLNNANEKYKLDYNGFFFRLGLKISP